MRGAWARRILRIVQTVKPRLVGAWCEGDYPRHLTDPAFAKAEKAHPRPSEPSASTIKRSKIISTIHSILRTLPIANRGRGLADKAGIFLVIAFETTAFANTIRRARIRRALGAMANEGLVTLRFARDGHDYIFKLRADEDGDISVASEFIRSGYEFPDTVPAQIIDGGANIGLFAVMASRRFPGVRVACFEANPDNIQALQRNLAINRANAVAINQALWSGDSEVVFHRHMAYSGHVAEGGAEPEAGDAIKVKAILPDVGADCWLKIDIEGAEYEVLPALFAAGRFPRWISAELHYYREKGAVLVQAMRHHGYSLRGVPDVAVSDEIAIFAERKVD